MVGDLLPLSSRLRFIANVSNVNAVFRLALIDPTSSLTFLKKRSASLEARTSSSDLARVVYVGCTISVAHNANADGEGMRAGWGLSRDVPAATTLVRKVKPSMKDLSSKYTFVFWRSLYGNGFDFRYVLSPAESDNCKDLEIGSSIGTDVSGISGRSVLIGGGG